MKKVWLKPNATVDALEPEDVLTSSGGVKEFLGLSEVDGPGDELDVSNF